MTDHLFARPDLELVPCGMVGPRQERGQPRAKCTLLRGHTGAHVQVLRGGRVRASWPQLRETQALVAEVRAEFKLADPR